MITGTLFILSAPSGTGKTTLLKKVMAQLEAVMFSISHTTRRPREGEQNGVDYHFVSRTEFEDAIDKGSFIEWAEVHTNLYGTSRKAIIEQLEKGVDVILDIDTQGAQIIRQAEDLDGVDIFVAPPNLAELENRLRGRGTDSDDSIHTRLKNAATEMTQADKYQYLVVNEDLELAAEMLKAVILAERARNRRLTDGQPIQLES